MAGNVFLKLGDIKGESKHTDHTDWIDVLAWSWGMSRDGTFHVGGGGSGGTAHVSDLNFTKELDAASADIQMKLLTGKHYSDATLHVIKEGDKPMVALEIKMEDVIIAAHSSSGSTGLPMENVSLNFAKVHYKYTGQEASGAEGTSPDFHYSIQEGAEM
jgi:type VI secretion system secreted protein Hcp